MAMYRSVDKLPKLPDPTGSLSTKVLSSSIVLANAGVKNVLEESVGEGKRGCYVKLSPDVDDGYRALFDMAAPRIPDLLRINVVSTPNRFNTRLAHRYCTFTCDVGVVSIHLV